jgi:hypothetical protein
VETASLFQQIIVEAARGSHPVYHWVGAPEWAANRGNMRRHSTIKLTSTYSPKEPSNSEKIGTGSSRLSSPEEKELQRVHGAVQKINVLGHR